MSTSDFFNIFIFKYQTWGFDFNIKPWLKKLSWNFIYCPCFSWAWHSSSPACFSYFFICGSSKCKCQQERIKVDGKASWWTFAPEQTPSEDLFCFFNQSRVKICSVIKFWSILHEKIWFDLLYCQNQFFFWFIKSKGDQY